MCLSRPKLRHLILPLVNTTVQLVKRALSPSLQLLQLLNCIQRDTTSSHVSFLPRYSLLSFPQSCLASVMLEYTKCISDSLKIFNKRVVEHLKVCEVHEDLAQKLRASKRNSRTNLEVLVYGVDLLLLTVKLILHVCDSQDDSGSTPVTPEVQIALDESHNVNIQTARTAQLRTYEFEEEKQAWMLLIRQAILDCQYLDKAADECQVPHSLQSTLASVPHSQASLHSITFSTSILAILTAHHEATFDRCLSSLISSVTSSACEMSLICDMRTDHASGDFNPFGGRSSTATRSRESSSSNIPAEKDPRLVCLYPDPYLARSAVAQRTVLLRVLMDRASELVTTCFSDICVDYRAIVEIHGVAMLRGKGKEDEVCYSSLLMVKFVEGVCAAFESSVGVCYTNFSGRGSHGSYEEEQQMKVQPVCSARQDCLPQRMLFIRFFMLLLCNPVARCLTREKCPQSITAFRHFYSSPQLSL